MIKPIMRDIFFLGQKSEPATKEDLQVGRDLQDTLAENRSCQVGPRRSASMRWTI